MPLCSRGRNQTQKSTCVQQDSPEPPNQSEDMEPVPKQCVLPWLHRGLSLRWGSLPGLPVHALACGQDCEVSLATTSGLITFLPDSCNSLPGSWSSRPPLCPREPHSGPLSPMLGGGVPASRLVLRLLQVQSPLRSLWGLLCPDL